MCSECNNILPRYFFQAWSTHILAMPEGEGESSWLFSVESLLRNRPKGPCHIYCPPPSQRTSHLITNHMQVESVAHLPQWWMTLRTSLLVTTIQLLLLPNFISFFYYTTLHFHCFLHSTRLYISFITQSRKDQYLSKPRRLT